MFDEQLQNDNYGYEKDYYGYIHLHSPHSPVQYYSESQNFYLLYVPNMLVIKIIIQIQSFVPRHFLQGKRFVLCQ